MGMHGFVTSRVGERICGLSAENRLRSVRLKQTGGGLLPMAEHQTTHAAQEDARNEETIEMIDSRSINLGFVLGG